MSLLLMLITTQQNWGLIYKHRRYYLLGLILFSVSCSNDYKTYKPQDDFSNEVFVFLLKKNKLTFEIDGEGFYAVEGVSHEVAMELLAEANNYSSSRFGISVKEGCERKALSSVVDGKAPYLIELDNNESSVTFTFSDKDYEQLSISEEVALLRSRCDALILKNSI